MLRVRRGPFLVGTQIEGVIDAAAIVSGRAMLRNLRETQLHAIACSRVLDPVDRVVRDLSAAVGIFDSTTAAGNLRSIRILKARRHLFHDDNGAGTDAFWKSGVSAIVAGRKPLRSTVL